MTVDMAKASEAIRRTADEIIAPRFGKLSKADVRQKSSPTDLVTEVDELAEAALRDRLIALAPDAEFVGEEAAASDPSIVAAISGPGRFWVVDPLDGTRNFVRGLPEFATIVALIENGRTVMGWIYAVPERSTIFAELGRGAFRDGAPIKARPASDAKPSGMRSLGWLNPDWEAIIRSKIAENVETTPSHCSAYAYLKLTSGFYDFKISSRIHPWDHAAGALILSELSGAAAYLDNDAPYAPADSVDRPMLATAPGRDWREIAGLLRS